jgi:simple sugar transport system ATP-binding protein
MSFGTNRVLDGVSLEVERGSVIALAGANGAGKSTLIKILSGVYGADSGQIRIDGEPVDIRTPTDASLLGIETVHQRIADGVIPGLTVAENLVFENLTRRGAPLFFTLRQVLPLAREVAASLELDWDDRMLRRDVFELGVSDQQILILARALSRKPRLLILDEPTSALSVAEAERLFTVVRGLKQSGVAVLYVSHRLGELDALADQLVVLRDGRLRLQQATPFDWNVALRAMLGEQTVVERQKLQEVRGTEAVLTLEGVRLLPERPPVDLELRAGEVTAVVGLLGAGKTELARRIFGCGDPATDRDGGMQLAGARYAPANPSDAIARGVFLVPEDRTREALIPGWSISRNLSLPFLKQVTRFGVLRSRQEADRGTTVVDALGIVANGEDHNVDELSGGNQQKVVVGRWLVQGPRVLLLDEPFRGVDIGARREIGAKARDLAQKGAVVVVLTSDVDEALEVADRLVVLVDGTVRLDAYTTETDRDELIKQMSEVALA